MADRSVSYVFKGNFTNLTAGLTAAGHNVQELGTKMTALDKNGRQMRAGLTQVGDAAGKVGLVAAAGFAVMVGAAAKFEQAMSSVGAATHETAGNMELLRKAALDAGKDTQYSATEAAGAIEELAKAGVSTADILGGGLSGSLNLAAAGAIEVADAAELAATTMTQFKLEGNQVNHVADLLAAGAGKAQGSVDDLGMALKQGGLVAAQTGLSIEETVGTLSAFASAGLLGSDAGTSFKTMLQSLTPSSIKAKEKMAELGISAYDAQGNFVGMANFAGQLKESLSTLSVEQQNAALKTIFGSDAVRAASVLYQQGATGIQGWIDKTNAAGYAADTAAMRTDNLIGDLERLGGALETAFIGAGSGSQGPLRELTQGATGAVDIFNEMPGAVQSSTTALLGLTAVIGAGAWFGSKTIQGIANTRQALTDLDASGSKTGRTLTRVGRVAGVAAIGITAFSTAVTLANKTDPAAGIEKNTRAILDFAAGAEDAEAQIDALFSRSSSSFGGPFEMKSEIEGLDDALRKLDTGSFTKLWSDPIFMDSDWDLARQSIEGIDEAMSQLVTQGYVTEAAGMFDHFESRALKAGYSTSEAASLLPQYGDALIGVENASKGAAGATGDFGTASERAALRVQTLKDALRKSKDAARDQAKAFLGLGDSLNDTKASLSDWIADMRKQADALRDFRVNAETAAKRGLRDGLIKALQEAGPEGALRMKQLANASKEQIGAANQSWQAGQREIRRYTDAVGGVPKTAGTNLKVNAGQAFNAIDAMKYALKHIPDETVNISLIRKRGAFDVATNRAGGGPVYGPGTETSDSIPARLSHNEFVVRASAHRRYGSSFMHAINEERFASGGQVGAATFQSVGDRLTAPKTVGEATAEIVALRRTLRSLDEGIRESEKTIRHETRARDLLSEKVDKNQVEVDRVTGLYDSLSSSIQAGLAANQFATVAGTENVWAAGAHGDRPPTFDEIIGALDKSTEDANAFSTATGTLSGSLSGSALQSILEQGLSTTQMFANLSAEQLAQYQATFDANATAVGAAGTAGGDAVYGAEMAKANLILAASQAEYERQTVELKTQTRQLAIAERQRDRAEKRLDEVRDLLRDLPRKIGDTVNGAASAGASRGKRGG